MKILFSIEFIYFFLAQCEQEWADYKYSDCVPFDRNVVYLNGFCVNTRIKKMQISQHLRQKGDSNWTHARVWHSIFE